MKTNFENIGGSYSQQGDYLFPNLTLSDENQSQIGVWGTRHRRYLKSKNLFEQTVKSIAEQEQVTEKLKAENMMLWVRKMNNIRNRATEIVNEQVIYR